MPPKKAGSKKKEVELQEPEHDPSWERVMLSKNFDLYIVQLCTTNLEANILMDHRTLKSVNLIYKEIPVYIHGKKCTT